MTQMPLITREGAKPKGRLSYVSAWIVCHLAILMPVRVRLTFTLVLNFAYNHILATGRMGASFMARALTHVLIALTYYLVLGPMSVLARLSRADYLHARDREGSLFLEKEPADDTEERFMRLY